MATGPCLVSRARTGTGRCFIEFEVTSLRFAIVGAGRLGASLARALRTKGLTLAGYTARTPAGRARAQSWLGGSATTGLQDLVAQDADIYFLTVPDGALSEVAHGLAALLDDRGRRVYVAHTSGATSVTRLLPCAEVGATTLALHPLQTFPDPLTSDQRFLGAAMAVTPDTSGYANSDGVSLGFALARALGAKPFLLADQDRPLYHAAATVSCNYFVTLQHLAKRLFVQSGLAEKDSLSMFLPLVRATLENIQNHGTTDALTGPLSRGDVDTVRQHLAALAQHAADVEPTYRALGLATLGIVQERAEVAPETVREMASLLELDLGNSTHATREE